MNTSLQKKILTVIKDKNKEKGIHNTQVRTWLFAMLVDNGQYASQDVDLNLKLLRDEGKIEFHDQNGMDQLPYRITALGYQEFDPWYRKVWRFFSNDMAKMLSLIATALGIVSILISFFGHKTTEIICK